MPSITHSFVSAVADDAGAAAKGEVLPSHWNAPHTDSSGNALTVRTILTANTNYYVATTGSDSNDGSLAHPWATVQHAVQFVGANIDGGGFSVTINIGAGVFEGAGLAGLPSFVGLGGAQGLLFVGAGSGSTKVQGTGGANPFDFNNTLGTAALIQNMTMTGDTNAFALVTCFGSGNSISLGTDTVFQGRETMNGMIVWSAPSELFLQGCTIDGSLAVGAITFVEASFGGVIQAAGAFTFTGSPNFIAVFNANFQGTVGAFNASFSGTATGNFIAGTSFCSFSGFGGVPAGLSLGTIDASSFYNSQPGGTSYIVSTLPPATISAGARSFVTDSTATLAAGLGNIVAGTGGNATPVYSDGTNWRIG